ncbi:hypothetical protein EBZ37_13745, partial [bacterium]|nr:hypothetical protein [bacterium]
MMGLLRRGLTVSRGREGNTSLLMVLWIGAAVATAALAMTSLQTQNAKQGVALREEKLRTSNISSLVQYVMLAVRSRWCLESNLTRSMNCNLAAQSSSEKLIISESNWNAILGKETPYPGNFAFLEGKIPESGDSLLVGTESHPLRLLLEQLDSDFKGLRWRIRRSCSASPSGGNDPNSCRAALPAPVGDETVFSLYFELIPKDSKPLAIGGNSHREEHTFAIIPRRMLHYAAIFKGDLSVNEDYSRSVGQTVNRAGLDSIIRFPVSPSANSPVISFHGPVL